MTAPEPLETTIARIIARMKGIDASLVTSEKTFAELGLDSLDNADLIFSIEDALDIEIPDGVAREMKSVGQAVEALRAHTASGAEAE